MSLRSFAESVAIIASMAILWWIVMCGDSGLKKCQERYSLGTCIHTMKGG